LFLSPARGIHAELKGAMVVQPNLETMPLRVLVVGQTPPPYGGQAAMVQLLLEAHFRGIQLFHVRMNFSQELDTAGKFRIAKLWELIRVVLCIYRERICHRPEVLYYPPSGPRLFPMIRDIFILGSTRWLFRATVFHFHASGISTYSRQLPAALRMLFQLAFRKPDLAIRISRRAPAEGVQLQSKREVIVPNGIPDSCGSLVKRAEDKQGPIRILFVGLLSEDKGVLVAVQAVHCLLMAGANLELTCLGRWESSEFRGRVLSSIDAKYQERFRFPGVIAGEQKWSYYRQANIFVFPSFFHSETFPVVLLEAMCFSLPVITTAWRGIPDVVEEGRSAILCVPKNMESCRKAIEKLVASPDVCEIMGKQGRARFLQYFTLDAHLDAMERALSALKG
jgi:glycosyltransferase involved in cell wall biosynthesis